VRLRATAMEGETEGESDSEAVLGSPPTRGGDVAHRECDETDAFQGGAGREEGWNAMPNARKSRLRRCGGGTRENKVRGSKTTTVPNNRSEDGGGRS